MCNNSYYHPPSPFKEGGVLLLPDLINPLRLGIFCAKFSWNWHIGSCEYIENIEFKKYIFLIISPLKRKWPVIGIHLNPLDPVMLYTEFAWLINLLTDQFLTRTWCEKVNTDGTDHDEEADRQQAKFEHNLRWAKNSHGFHDVHS